MRAKALSHPGLVRTSNEDAFLANVKVGLFAVADGMGGHLAGEVASWLAVRTVEAALSAPPAGGEPQELLCRAMMLANTEIFRQSEVLAGQRGMGTTLTVAWLLDSCLYLGHVGDSSAYHYRDGRLDKLTQDHSLVAEMQRLGGLSEEEARLHPQRHVLTRAVGTEASLQVDTRIVRLEPGDALLLCTDGLSSLVSLTDIEKIMRRTGRLKRVLDSLLRLALEQGAPDNVTMVLVNYD